MAKLSDGEVERALASLKGWSRDGDFITKEFHFRAFMDGIRFVDKVAKIADMQVVWTTVTLKIQTHDEGGITKWDIALAKEIEKHLASAAKKPSKCKA